MKILEPCDKKRIPTLTLLNVLSCGVDSNKKLNIYEIKYGIIPIIIYLI